MSTTTKMTMKEARLLKEQYKERDLNSRGNPLYWSFIPSRIDELVKDLEIAFHKVMETKKKEEWPDVRFLDVGCGMGNVMIAFQALFYSKLREMYKNVALKVAGIEHNKELSDIAIQNSQHIIFGDALEYKDYSKFDIIHYYRPIKNEPMMALLEERIEKQAKKNAVIIARYKVKPKVSEEKFTTIKLQNKYNSDLSCIFQKYGE